MNRERLRLLRSAYELRQVAETHPHLGVVPLVTAYACRVRASPPGETWPRVTDDGRTVWACCVSTIGPTCPHRV